MNNLKHFSDQIEVLNANAKMTVWKTLKVVMVEMSMNIFNF